MLGVADACPSAHRLDVARLGSPEASQGVLVSDRALADIADDFHVLVTVEIESRARSDLVVIPDDEDSKGAVGGVALRRDFEMVARLQPPEVTSG